MLYDLSIVWTPSTTQADIENTLSMSAELGYHVVALDHVYHGAVPSIIESPFAAVEKALTIPSKPKLLHRATVVLSDMTTNYRLSAVAAAYDIVAVRPTTEKAFQAACLNMAEPALISLDLTTYFPFYFKHRVCMTAVRRGLHFEVCYAHALRSTPGKDSGRARALFVANLTGLIRATRGRGIVVSSGAMASGGGGFELRGPADIVNLLAVWGLPPDRGTDAMSALPQSIVANEGLRRRGFRGAIDIVETAGGDEPGVKDQPGPKQGQKQKQGQKAQKQKGNQNQSVNKRKADDGLAGVPQGKPQQAKKQRK